MEFPQLGEHKPLVAGGSSLQRTANRILNGHIPYWSKFPFGKLDDFLVENGDRRHGRFPELCFHRPLTALLRKKCAMTLGHWVV